MPKGATDVLIARLVQSSCSAWELITDHVELTMCFTLEVIEDRLASRWPRRVILIIALASAPLASVCTVYVTVGVKCEANAPTHFYFLKRSVVLSAICAANCSACFFVLPKPDPYGIPSTTTSI